MPKGSKVLMADDDKMLLDMYKERLELAGYVVEAGFNGEELLAKVHGFAPDIIMLDVMMPKMNGYETLASLKSDPTTKNIPVVMLSALMRDFNREKAVEGGAEDYLIKSEAMPSDVITKIEQVLQKYGRPAATPVASAATASTTVAQTPVVATLAAAATVSSNYAPTPVAPTLTPAQERPQAATPAQSKPQEPALPQVEKISEQPKAVPTPENVNAPLPNIDTHVAEENANLNTVVPSSQDPELQKILEETAQTSAPKKEEKVVFEPEKITSTSPKQDEVPDLSKETPKPLASTTVGNQVENLKTGKSKNSEWIPLVIIIGVLVVLLAISFYYFVILQP